MSHKVSKHFSILVAIIQLIVIFGAFLPSQTHAQAAPFTQASFTLANGRLSFKGALATSGYINSTTLKIANSSQPDIDTKNLFYGDNICINPTGAVCHQQALYSVNYLATDDLTFGLATALPHAIADATPVVSSQSGLIVVKFRPRVAIPVSGSIKVYIPAHVTNTTAQDGIPDQTGFDSARIDDISAGSFGSVVSVSGGSFTTTGASITYTHASSNHVLTIPVSNAGGLDTSTDYYITIGSTGGDRQLFINPSPASTHSTRGVSDSYNFKVESYDASANLRDSTTTAVVVNDGVLVTVTVPVSLTYTVTGIASSTAISCPGVSGGITTRVTTTATSVPFGTLSTAANGGIANPIDAAQQHAITTNAPNGYSLTVYEDALLTSGSNTIPDVTCNGGGDTACATPTSNGTWNSTASYGFGYSVVGNNAAGIADVTSAGVTGYRPFRLASALSWPTTTLPVTIMTRTSSTSSSTAYTCYRLNVDTAQVAGFYYNKLYYVATARF